MRKSIFAIILTITLSPVAFSEPADASADYTSRHLPQYIEIAMTPPTFALDKVGVLKSISAQLKLSSRIDRNSVSYIGLLMSNSVPVKAKSGSAICQNFITLWAGDPLGPQNAKAIPISSRTTAGDGFTEKATIDLYVSETNILPCPGKYVLGAINLFDTAGRDLTIVPLSSTKAIGTGLQFSTFWSELGANSKDIPCKDVAYSNLNPAPIVRTLCDQKITPQSVTFEVANKLVATEALPQNVDYQPQLVASLTLLNSTKLLYQAEIAMNAKLEAQNRALTTKINKICSVIPKPANC